MKINYISPLENKLTEKLDGIALMPKTLYFYGEWPELRLPSVAIVGARKNTSYGEKIAYEAAYELAKRGVVVVSGLAYGIDSIAHRAALDAGGLTVAVLGTPIDQIYPRAHCGLAEKIVQSGGVVMSELASGMEYHPKVSFLERNRLISGLSDVVLIVEAAERSGTLNTAAHALNQGREVFAVPGDITRINSAGCHRLIAQGATPYTRPEDILERLFPAKGGRRRIVELGGDNAEETAILQLLQSGVDDGEAMIRKLKLPVASFNQALTMLELKGRVRALGGNKWMLR